jgi:hypothetical protein
VQRLRPSPDPTQAEEIGADAVAATRAIEGLAEVEHDDLVRSPDLVELIMGAGTARPA